ncbi:MAG: DUF5677 domain-containing protein [Methanoregula sp.]
MEFIKELYWSEKHCEAQSRHQLKSKIQLMEEMLIFYKDLIEKQNKDETNLELCEFATILIHVKIFKTIYCNIDLLKKGHYNEFQSIFRDAFELIFLSQYIIKNPEKADSWLDGEQISHGPVANSLKLPQEIREIYASLCDYTHPNMKSAAKNMVLSKRYGEFDFYFISIFQNKLAKKLIIMQIYFTFLAINKFFDCFKNFKILIKTMKSN